MKYTDFAAWTAEALKRNLKITNYHGLTVARLVSRLPSEPDSAVGAFDNLLISSDTGVGLLCDSAAEFQASASSVLSGDSLPVEDSYNIEDCIDPTSLECGVADDSFEDEDSDDAIIANIRSL